MCLLHVICQKYTCNELNVKIYNIQTDNLICFQLFFSLPNEVRDVLVFLVGFPSFFLSFILSFFFFFTPTMALSKENPQIFNAISLLTFMGLQTFMNRCASLGIFKMASVAMITNQMPKYNIDPCIVTAG